MSDKLVILISMLMVLALVACGEGNTDLSRNEESFAMADQLASNMPNPESPLEVRARLVSDRVFRRGERIEIDVALKNITSSPILACLEPEHVSQRILRFLVFDSTGKRLNPSEGDFSLSLLKEEDSLRPLAPGESRSFTRDLLSHRLAYPFQHGSYSVVAVYHCPFDGMRVSDGLSMRIAGELQRSEPFELNVDYGN